MLNTIAVAAGKGGVLKTTLACHLAVAASETGSRVLLVDADPQGNTAIDLGYRSDGGSSLARAMIGGERPEPIRAVRPGLDVLAGGRRLDDAALHIARAGSDDCSLRCVLDRFEPDYRLIIIDCPARELVIRRAALTAASFVVIPSTSDLASYHGLADLAGTITEVRQAGNPELDVLGIVAGPIPVTSTDLRSRTIADLGRYIDDPSLVSSATIRYSSLTAERCRANGLVTSEFADRNPSAASARLAHDWQIVTSDLLLRHHDVAMLRQQTAARR